MSLVERCWMITSKFSVIAILIITGICFGVFVYPYMKKKREAALVSIVYIGIMSVLYLIPQQIGNFSAYMLGVVAAFLVMYVQDRRNIYPVIDVILMEKLREAKEKQIRFISDFHYPGDTKLNAFDLSVILNNALNNCMENVSGENPYISLSSFRKNSIFMITIKNRYEGVLTYKDCDLPETTKSGKEHGIGLHNIRRVARMYMGDISLEQENQEVVLSIMLQVE